MLVYQRVDPIFKPSSSSHPEGEKRALYASYRSELLTISATAEVSIRNGPRSPGLMLAWWWLARTFQENSSENDDL
jgi:hypothetical protein